MHLSLKVGARDSNPTNYSKNSLETLPTFNLRLVVSCYILNTKCFIILLQFCSWYVYEFCIQNNVKLLLVKMSSYKNGDWPRWKSEDQGCLWKHTRSIHSIGQQSLQKQGRLKSTVYIIILPHTNNSCLKSMYQLYFAVSICCWILWYKFEQQVSWYKFHFTRWVE